MIESQLFFDFGLHNKNIVKYIEQSIGSVVQGTSASR